MTALAKKAKYYATTLLNHNGNMAPFCLDLFPSIGTDDRGLYQREPMVGFMRAIEAAAVEVVPSGRGSTNDFAVAAATNERLGANRVTYMGGDGTNNWHGALNLHVHCNITPSGGPSANAGPKST